MNGPLTVVEIDLSRRLVVTKETLVRELDGELLLLCLATQTYYGLDKVGTRIWHALEASPNVHSALEQLLEEYDVDPETLRRHVQQLVRELVDHKLFGYADSEPPSR